MPSRDIIVIGASAGGVEALSRVTADFPVGLPAAVFVVLHVAPTQTSLLPQILARRSVLPVAHARGGEPIEHGRVYVAPPDHHLLLAEDRVRLVQSARENGHRPAVDPLFRSAAAVFGPRVVGVILSGSLDDGTEGLRAVKRRGGVAVVQDPDDAHYPGMPRNAVDHAHPDLIAPLAGIGKAIVSLVEGEKGPGSNASDESSEADDPGELGDPVDDLEAELAWADRVEGQPGNDPPLGAPSGFTCPECHGGLWDLSDDRLSRFRCRVGHAYTAESLVAEQAKDFENALWIALRTLEDPVVITRRLAERARMRRHAHTARQFESQAADAQRRAEHLRAALVEGATLSAVAGVDAGVPTGGEDGREAPPVGN